MNSKTPGAFRTKVVTQGVDPQISCYYKASRIKQYFKAHRALRTETVICDTRDFGIGRRVCLENRNALRAAGEHDNQRLCDAEAADAQPAPDTVTFAEVTRPTSTAEGLHAPALRFGDPRVMAVLAATLRFTHLIAGFDNRSLTELVSTLLAPHTPAGTRLMTCGGSGANRSSSGSPAPTATGSRPTAVRSPSCSPRPTAGYSPPA